MDNNKTAGHMHDNKTYDLSKMAGSQKTDGSSCSCTSKSDERPSDAQPCSCSTDNISRLSAIPTINSTPMPEIL